MRTGRGAGGKGIGGRPYAGTPSLRSTCPVCDAPVGERCRTYRVEHGERLYVRGHRVKVHPERTAAARAERGGA